MKKESDIIGYDFQGWPIYKMNLREILKKLGATEIPLSGGATVLGFDPEDVRLDFYPRTLEDDGMGYGVNEKYITNVNIVDNTWCNIFIG